MAPCRASTPNRDAARRFLGLNPEGIFYDPESLVEPIRIIRNLHKINRLKDLSPFVVIECTATIYPVDGLATTVAPGTVIDYEIPDLTDRPWARLWEHYHEPRVP